MNSTIHKVVAIAASALLCGAPAAATPPTGAPAAAQVQVSGSAAKAAARQRAAATKPVDINSASKAQLTKLPGISEADALRIIAGRPYLTKAQLVTHGVIPMGAYQRIDLMIMARQPDTNARASLRN